MSRLPYIQFYFADWRNNAKLRRCGHAARGAFLEIMGVLHDSDEYGVVRWPLKELAAVAGVPIRLAKELAEKSVLKGSDNGVEPYVFRPTHARRQGDPVTLLEASDGPCWYSSRMIRDAYIRSRRGLSRTPDYSPDRSPKYSPNLSPKPPFGDAPNPSPPSRSETETDNRESERRERMKSGSDMGNPISVDQTPTLDQIKAYGMTAGVPPETCEWFYNDMEACGWRNRHGLPIRRWKPLLANVNARRRETDHLRVNSASARNPAPAEKPVEIIGQTDTGLKLRKL